jgi:hypothetical protein
MPKAYVLINVESGAEELVIKELRAIGGVEESYYSYGVYDIIAKVNAENHGKTKRNGYQKNQNPQQSFAQPLLSDYDGRINFFPHFFLFFTSDFFFT